MIEVIVAGLGLAPPSNAPLLLLKERTGDRVLPVGIGPLEAQAIAMPLQGVQPPRPMTHDVFVNVLSTLAAHLLRVEVVSLTDNTFYARLVLEHGGRQESIDIRPSDAVALAVRTETPIFVAEEVLDTAGLVTRDEEQSSAAEGSASDEIDESKLSPFKEFIETLDLDDLEPGPGGSGGPGENRS